jgi:AcrR family transcriptional regulator
VSDAQAEPPDESPPVDELRERLLTAAAAVFARRGYDGTKIVDIVRESGLSTGAVYGRFRSKNDLLREAVVTRAAGVTNVYEVGDGRVADLITAWGTNITEPLTDLEAMRIEAYVTARREPEVRDAIGVAHQAWERSMRSYVDDARRDGTLGEGIDPAHVIFFLRVFTLGMLVHRGAGVPVPDPAGWAGFLRRLIGSFGAPTAPADAAGSHRDSDSDAETEARGPAEGDE